MESGEKSDKTKLQVRNLSIRSNAPSPPTPMRNRNKKQRLSTNAERNSTSQRNVLVSSDEGR